MSSDAGIEIGMSASAQAQFDALPADVRARMRVQMVEIAEGAEMMRPLAMILFRMPVANVALIAQHPDGTVGSMPMISDEYVKRLQDDGHRHVARRRLGDSAIMTMYIRALLRHARENNMDVDYLRDVFLRELGASDTGHRPRAARRAAGRSRPR